MFIYNPILPNIFEVSVSAYYQILHASESHARCEETYPMTRTWWWISSSSLVISFRSLHNDKFWLNRSTGGQHIWKHHHSLVIEDMIIFSLSLNQLISFHRFHDVSVCLSVSVFKTRVLLVTKKLVEILSACVNEAIPSVRPSVLCFRLIFLLCRPCDPWRRLIDRIRRLLHLRVDWIDLTFRF